MTIAELYEKYQIHEGLQLHMYRVAAVAIQIVDAWDNPGELDKTTIVETALIHDFANIVKADFDKYFHLISDNPNDKPRWQKIKEDFIEKYGADEHQATIAIAKENNAPAKIIDILEHTDSDQLPEIVLSNNLYYKVCKYPDFRVGPSGVISLNERWDEIRARYEGSPHTLGNIEKTEKKRNWSLELEQQLQQRVKIDLIAITEKTTRPIVDILPNWKLGFI